MGNVFKYGNSVDTDVILPARYLALFQPNELAAHCMEDIDPLFSRTVHPGDVIVAGENFGCGSSREHAPLAIKACGISCVIAASFARIFYRNAINIGLPIIESPQAANGILHGDKLEIDWKTGVIRNLTQNSTYQIGVFPEFIQDIINDGGLLASIKASLQLQENTHPTN
ncbi:putative 3-isopropylmalate dehydratase, small subunit [Clostridiales bacterium 1_7_47FAA]|uniref:3-isopropylmalate dehydratase small subunit n=1 Tax=Enterocloster hominis (ex Hitch et al. 2024) TaxID=1917870 RepID=A0ABV1D9F5_9FIRM|nr:putative 3-isopropylmalate dehydratase, small subunit [Clostridiales bacterium 1_7_47FAA]